MEQPKYHDGPGRLTIEEMQAIAASRDGLCLSVEYVNSQTPLEWECVRGHRWWATAAHVKTGTWCRVCLNHEQSGTLAAMQRIAQSRGGACLSQTYVNSTTKLTWRCAEGHVWEALPRSVCSPRNTWCPVCYWKGKRDTLENMKRLAAERGGRCLATSYVNGVTRLEWMCASGHTWMATPAAIKQGSWCPVCAKARFPTLDTMMEVAEQRGGVCLSERYINNATPLRWRCARGHEWMATPFSVQQGTWCRQCFWDGMRGSLAEMQAVAAARGGRCLSQQYVDSQTRLTWECHRGHTWQAIPNAVKQGRWCPLCANLERSKQRGKRLKYDFEG